MLLLLERAVVYIVGWNSSAQDMVSSASSTYLYQSRFMIFTLYFGL